MAGPGWAEHVKTGQGRAGRAGQVCTREGRCREGPALSSCPVAYCQGAASSPDSLSRQNTSRSLPKTCKEATTEMMARVSMAMTALPRTFSSSQLVPCTVPACVSQQGSSQPYHKVNFTVRLFHALCLHGLAKHFTPTLLNAKPDFTESYAQLTHKGANKHSDHNVQGKHSCDLSASQLIPFAGHVSADDRS